MKRWLSCFLPRSTSSVAWAATMIILVISSMAVAGWVLDITLLKSIMSEWVSMRVNTAVCLMLAAVGLVFLQKWPSGRNSFVLRAPGALVAITGLFTTALYVAALITGQEFQLANAPFLDFLWVQDSRMALLTSILFLLSGCALILLARDSRNASNIAHILILPVCIISYFIPVSYFLGVQGLHAFLRVPVAFNTGFAFFSLAVAILFVRPDTWLMSVLTADHAGGVMGRRLLPAILVTPILIGWLRLHGERSGAFVSEVGVAFVAVAYTVCLLSLVLLTADSLNRTDSKVKFRTMELEREIADRKQAEEELRKNQRDLNRAQAVAKIGSWWLDVRQNMLLWSDETYRMFGIPKGTNLTYETFLSRVHPDDRKYVDQKWAAALRGENYDIEHRMIVGEQIYWVREKAELELDGQGGLLGGFGTVQDITELKQMENSLRESESRYRHLFESMSEGFAAHDMIFDAANRPIDYRFIEVNPAFSNLTGLDPGNIIGHTVKEVVPDVESEWIEMYGEVVSTGKARRFESESAALGRWFEGYAYPIGQERFAVAFTDVTNRKIMEQELRKSRDELELRVRERTAELQRSNQALQDFAAIASHDMKEPLRKVISFGSILQQKHQHSLGKTGKDYLNRMIDASQRMQSLLTSLLEYSRVTMNPEPFKEVDLFDTVHEVLSDLEARIQKSGGEVHVGELPAIKADPTQMRQLFQNLIGNALKFHKHGTKPIVKVHCTPSPDSGCQIIVEDNGIGFDEQCCDKIFAPFQRLRDRNEFEGTGIGLAICKKIVERHGGSIIASSAPGKGSIFIITFPLAAQ